MAKDKRKQCGCGAEFEPKNSEDNICPICRYYLRALHSRDIHFVEQLRREYIKQYSKYISYGQFVAKLQDIERRRVMNDD